MGTIDIDEARRAEIAFHGLTGADRPYTFYHDETNNIRRLEIIADGFNVAELKVFVLGGIVHEGALRPIDLEPLRCALGLQRSAREIKLKHIAKGGFLDALQSRRQTTFLNWLGESEFLVQYHELDPLFWSIADIVDSILAGRTDFAHLYACHMLLKSDLTSLLRADIPAAVRLFRTYGYAGIDRGDCRAFLSDLLELIECSCHAIDHDNYMMIRGVIQAGRSLDSSARRADAGDGQCRDECDQILLR